MKELNDKYTDWKGSGLPITTVGVCAGIFNSLELIATIKQRGIPIFFEHALHRLEEFLKQGQYYAASWNPSGLFQDEDVEKVATALEEINTAPVDDSDVAQQNAPGEPGDE